MKIFVICTVRNATKEYQKMLENYVEQLELEGYEVHLPHRDTNQDDSGIDICTQNTEAIKESNEVHISYNPSSQGTHFDMGVAFGLGKKIVLINELERDSTGKSFKNMLLDWSK